MPKKLHLMDILPPELVRMFLVTLNCQDLSSFCMVSKKANKICKNDYFWRLKMQRDFEHYFPCIREASSPLNTWYKKYKCYFKSRQNEFVEALMYFDPEIEKAQQLLALGVSPNTKDPTGNTGLIYASDCGRLDIARMMLDAGADAKAKNDAGKTSFDYAKENENIKGTDVYWRLNDARF